MLKGGKFCVSRLIVSPSALAEANGRRAISAPRKAQRKYFLLVGMLRSRVDRTSLCRTGIGAGRLSASSYCARLVTSDRAAMNPNSAWQDILCVGSLTCVLPSDGGSTTQGQMQSHGIWR